MRARGPFIEVIPPSFANGLAASALRGRLAQLRTLFSALQISRHDCASSTDYRQSGTDEVNQLWEDLFSPAGLLKDLQFALEHASLLNAIARAVPKRAAELIENGLTQMSLPIRKEIRSRRELIYALQELLYRRHTAASALRSLALLAEAESETYANNATHIFADCFIPGHPQFPLPLTDRPLYCNGSPPQIKQLIFMLLESRQSRPGWVCAFQFSCIRVAEPNHLMMPPILPGEMYGSIRRRWLTCL